MACSSPCPATQGSVDCQRILKSCGYSSLMSELVKKSTADFIRPSARELSSAFLDGLMKMSMAGSSASAPGWTDDDSATTGAIHSLWVKLSLMASLWLLAKLLKALITSSIGALASNSVIGGLFFSAVVFVVMIVVMVVVVVAVVVVGVVVVVAIAVKTGIMYYRK
jgi:hypothetical protein